MSSKPEGAGARACWFVGASYGRTEDQTSRFLREGIWENGYQDKYLETVKSIQAGDRIAIKASYTRKLDLPFDNRGQTVSVMAIKAIGKVKENYGDGRTLKVDWKPYDPPREWYFYTNRSTVWRVLPGDWTTDALIGFTFEEKSQDINRFRNAPYWRERFGDTVADKRRFNWTRFYEAMADQILSFRNRRSEMVSSIHVIAERHDCMSILNDQYEKGVPGGPLKDICPFTVMGIFNRGITDANRKALANELASLLGVSVAVPDSFEGIPVVNNQRSWFFAYSYQRQPDDIDALWEIFAQAIAFSDTSDAETRSAFTAAFDNASERWGVGWNLTMGLYWIRPWSFPTLDGQSQNYISKKLNIQIGKNGPKGRCSARDYLELLDTLEARFQEDAYPVHSFPELSLAAWLFKGRRPPPPPPDPEIQDDDADSAPEEDFTVAPIEPYSLDDILSDGCFISREKIEKILERLRTKKNLILQGPPGTGKTWLAKRLAFALIGQRDDSKVRAVQFHPNLSYEDFIRGWRPIGDGKLTLVDGPFLEMMKSASKEPTSRHVVVIEEINRGNPAQIFGEMLTLLEADKRTPNEALELSYKRSDGERVFIPDNLYVIGTMNIADRSLALVDLALRRRFAFIDLEPTLGKPWQDWVQSQCGIDVEILAEIEHRLTALNSNISADTGLGPQFRVGHSYVTPPFGVPINNAREWFRQVVDTEIGPLLDEYWFDALEKSKKARERLLEGF
ncbi:5-methylcytosine-specific restriction enzyme B [Desulfonatronum zhilinae]|nr:5-methylcytosine-specific restriction enzyme B [Desulfonatronum zhilinae]